MSHKHFAVGGGLAADGTKFSFSAHANTPDPPSGYAHVSGISPLTGPFDVQGHVVCFVRSVIAKTARVSLFEKPNASFPNGSITIFQVEDNPPGSAQPDQFSLLTLRDQPSELFCTPSTVLTGSPVVQGNIVVK